MSVPIETIIDDNEIAANAGFVWREKNGVKLLVCKELDVYGFVNGFSTRLGGVSPFREGDLNLAGFDEDLTENIFENRKRFLAHFPDFRLATVWQVHGDDVKLVDSQQTAEVSEDKFDALVSNLKGTLLGVKTADCVPVLLGDPKIRAFAAIHAGWRGTLASIVPKAIELMSKTYGSKPNDMIVAIGPAASAEHYEVGQDVIDLFSQEFSYTKELFKKSRDGHAFIDLHFANRRQLIDKGVNESKISTAPYCTMKRTDLFFSYRKEKQLYGKTGRLLSVIGSR
ncbi:MAG: peptidoglycan editing factor PgeF [Pyrinomonadaceae bacterium]